MDASIVAETTVPFVHQRRLIFGIGVNDFPSRTHVDGKDIIPYTIWHAMMARCYSKARQEKQPTYVGCTVAGAWHFFSNFERWFTKSYFEGAALDKDLLVPGNKVYSEDTCLLVSRMLNSLLVDHSKGNYPVGASAKGTKFMARVRVDGYDTYLGTFDTPFEAHRAWQYAKLQIISDFQVADPRIRKALDLRVAQLRDDLANNRITLSL